MSGIASHVMSIYGVLSATSCPNMEVISLRKGDVLPYEGAIDERSMNVFRELVNHPVVTLSHRIQVDLVLKVSMKYWSLIG